MKDLDDLIEEQGWSDATVLAILADYLHASGTYDTACRYAAGVATLASLARKRAS
jgi:hypothetical protein